MLTDGVKVSVVMERAVKSRHGLLPWAFKLWPHHLEVVNCMDNPIPEFDYYVGLDPGILCLQMFSFLSLFASLFLH